jgi:regulator of replication initiation timing
MTKLEEAFEEELEKRHSTLCWQLKNANQRIENLIENNQTSCQENKELRLKIEELESKLKEATITAERFQRMRDTYHKRYHMMDDRSNQMNQLARQLADLLDAPWRQLPEETFDKEIHLYTREKSTTPPEYPEREIQVIRSQQGTTIKVSLLILPDFVRKGDDISLQNNEKTKWIRGHNLTLQNEDTLIPILLEKMLTEDFNWNDHFFKGEILPEAFKE